MDVLMFLLSVCVHAFVCACFRACPGSVRFLTNLLRLKQALQVNGLDEKMQSAGTSGQSMITARLRVVKNDILMAINDRKTVALVLLDLSAAFDTVDREMRCRRPEILRGLCEKPLVWFRSYLVRTSQLWLKHGSVTITICS